MPIEVECPNGHRLRLKDKYAGKSGLCPRCQSRIDVPHVLRDDDILEMLGEYRSPVCDTPNVEGADDADVLNDPKPREKDSGLSLLGSSIIRHNKVCPKCYGLVPHWFATCSHCGLVFRDFEVGQAGKK